MPLSTTIDFIDSIDGELNPRLVDLALLYIQRRTNPYLPEVSLLEVEKRMGFPRDYLEFTAWYLRKAGHDVMLVERQAEAGMETSWGNGGVIHASEVEPWSQPGMPTKIIKWLGQENAPMLLRYGAIPHIIRWGIDFARNCSRRRSF